MTAKLDRVRLVKVLGMLGSRHDGEVLSAARLAQYMLSQSETTWAELLGVKPGAEPEQVPQADEEATKAATAFYKGKYADPDYPDMVRALLKNRALEAKSRRRLEMIEDQLRRGLTLALDDKLLVRWLYHTVRYKPKP